MQIETGRLHGWEVFLHVMFRHNIIQIVNLKFASNLLEYIYILFW